MASTPAHAALRGSCSQPRLRATCDTRFMGGGEAGRAGHGGGLRGVERFTCKNVLQRMASTPAHAAPKRPAGHLDPGQPATGGRAGKAGHCKQQQQEASLAVVAACMLGWSQSPPPLPTNNCPQLSAPHLCSQPLCIPLAPSSARNVCHASAPNLRLEPLSPSPSPVYASVNASALNPCAHTCPPPFAPDLCPPSLNQHTCIICVSLNGTTSGTARLAPLSKHTLKSMCTSSQLSLRTPASTTAGAEAHQDSCLHIGTQHRTNLDMLLVAHSQHTVD